MDPKTRKMDMNIMHNMCQKELQKLQQNIDRFVVNSEKAKALISTTGELNCGTRASNNVLAFIEFDRYMAQITTILNMARKFNIQLELNDFPDAPFSDLADKNSRLFHEILQRSIFRQKFDLFAPDNCVLTHLHGSNFNESHSADCNNNAERNAIELPLPCGDENPISNENSAIKLNLYAYNVDQYLQTILPKRGFSHFTFGYIFSAMITYVKDPNTLTFYICERNKYLNIVQINRLCDQMPKRCLTTSDKLFCVWLKNCDSVKIVSRAVLLPEKFCQEPQSVLLVDSGERIHLNDEWELFEMTPEQKKIPPLAVKCILKGTCDPRGLLVTDHSKCKTILMAREHKMEKFKVLGIEDDKLEVIMLATKEESRQSLLSSPPSTAIKTTSCFIDESASASEEKDFNPSKDRHRKTSEMNQTITTKTRLDNINPFLNSFLLEDEAGSGKSNNHMPLPISSVYGNSPSECTLNSCKSVNIGANLQVTVTYITNPLNFYGVIDDFSNGETFFWSDADITPTQKELSSLPKLNSFVLARYDKDGHWYRARIIDIIPNDDLYKVFYIDFGNTEVVSQICIASCNPEQILSPPQANLFRIHGIELAYNEDNFLSEDNMHSKFKMATQALVGILLNQTINVKVVDRSRKFGYDEIIVSFFDKTLYENITLILLHTEVVKIA
uniref:Tudor domain-containing protein n=1 Tax=Stomoxys calcitrans TaxID=35570 RepID=A0A1I8QA47_STOCA